MRDPSAAVPAHLSDAVTEQSTGRADERLAGLVRLARVMADTRSLNELAERVCEEARFALGARNVSLSRLEPEHGLVRTLVNVGELATGDARFPDDETYMVADFPLLGAMVDEARPWRVQVDDPATDLAERELLVRMGATVGDRGAAAGRGPGLGRAVRDARPRVTVRTTTTTWRSRRRSPGWCRPGSPRSSTCSWSRGWRTTTRSPGSATAAWSRTSWTARSRRPGRVAGRPPS